MKTAGIICEYNPFHLGHARQLRLTRELLGQETAIVCVMSGNYVQRGVCAMWDKFTRARAAVACGADGVMIEVHPDPAHALCDGAQSLNPEQFDTLMKDIKRRVEFEGKTLC